MSGNPRASRASQVSRASKPRRGSEAKVVRSVVRPLPPHEHHLAHASLRLLLSMGAGLALYSSFAPLSLWPLAFLGVALFLGLLEGRSFPRSLLTGWIVGLAFYLPLFSWARIGSGLLVPWFALGAIEALYLALLALIWQGIMRLPRCGQAWAATAWGRSIALAATWVGIEHVRSTWPLGGMPWGQLAFSQVDGPLLHLAPWGSTHLVAGVTVALGSVLELLALRLTHRMKGSLMVPLGACLGALVVSLFLPLFSGSSEFARVGLVQGIIPQPGSVPEGQSRALTVTNNLFTATRQLEPGSVDMVLWPESASDRDVREDPEARAIVNNANEYIQAPLLLGTQRFVEDYRFNDYLVWDSDRVLDTYTKQRPVPFGEYMPYRDFFAKFTSAAEAIYVDMHPGSGAALLEVPRKGGEPIRVATPICFEVAMTDIVAEAVAEGAELIVIPTNNASYGTSGEAYQQFAMTRFRAVEYGRTAIHVSTVGVSGIVEPNGVVRTTTKPWAEESLTARVPLRTELTPATILAPYLGPGSFIVGGALALWAWGSLVWRWWLSR